MEILIYLSILLAIVTVVGHAIWITLAALFRVVTGNESNSSQFNSTSKRPVLTEDLAATRRLIQYIQQVGISDPEQIQQLQLLVEKTEHHHWLATANRIDQSRAASQERTSTVPSAPLAIPTPQSRSRVSENVPSDQPIEQPIVASLVTETPFSEKQPQPSAPSLPKRATSEVLQSFLAAHNIRWGELTAGILIVVCSIGLVISLWSTLTETNRLIPASLFLAAVAAIEGAGLYTLRRWKLHDQPSGVDDRDDANPA